MQGKDRKIVLGDRLSDTPRADALHYIEGDETPCQIADTDMVLAIAAENAVRWRGALDLLADDWLEAT